MFATDYSSKKDNYTRDNRLDLIRNVHNEKKEQEIRTDRMKDYLEVIYELIQHMGYATTADISKYLSVRSPSVTKIVMKLDENHYFICDKYRGLRLTEAGTRIAQNIQEKHRLVAEFLKKIGVEDEIAHLDVEGMEHLLYPQTIKRLEKLIPILKKIKLNFVNELKYFPYTEMLMPRIAMEMEDLYQFLNTKYLQSPY